MLGVFNPVSSSINIKQIISELPVTLRIGIMRSITSVLLVVINYFRMDNHIALIHMLMGTKLILKWIIIVEVSLLEKKVFSGKETGEKYSDFDNYASGQYDYYHGVLNVKINKMDNAEYNYLKGKL